MKRTVIVLSSVGLVLVLLVGCKKSPEPTPPAPPSQASEGSPASQEAPAAKPGSSTLPSSLPSIVTWEDPPEWKRLPPSNPMRKATYRIPKSGTEPEDAELAVFYFGPNQGGSIDANVDRWVTQFTQATDVKRSERSANDLRQHIVEIEKGTFSSGMPGGPTTPKAGYGLLGAIVLTPSGPYFFKLTGPTATLARSRETFFKLLDSVKAS